MNSDIETPINLGNPREGYTMIGSIAQIIIKMSHLNSDFILNDLPDDPQRRCPDISFAQSELGWTPKINLSEGIPSNFKLV